jgi:hypothetical protein
MTPLFHTLPCPVLCKTYEFWNLEAPGFNLRCLSLFEVDPSQGCTRAGPTERVRAYAEARRRTLRALPGCQRVGSSHTKGFRPRTAYWINRDPQLFHQRSLPERRGQVRYFARGCRPTTGTMCQQLPVATYGEGWHRGASGRDETARSSKEPQLDERVPRFRALICGFTPFFFGELTQLRVAPTISKSPVPG